MRPRPPKNVECPHCGAAFARGRLACPECGSDAQTGWRSDEDVEYEAVDLPEPFDPEAPPPRRTWSLVVTVTAVVLIMALLILALVRF